MSDKSWNVAESQSQVQKGHGKCSVKYYLPFRNRQILLIVLSTGEISCQGKQREGIHRDREKPQNEHYMACKTVHPLCVVYAISKTWLGLPGKQLPGAIRPIIYHVISCIDWKLQKVSHPDNMHPISLLFGAQMLEILFGHAGGDAESCIISEI